MLDVVIVNPVADSAYLGVMNTYAERRVVVTV